jgi:ribonuclease H / adenosylcobalamin/alpha-ribazole phosphatase
MIIFVRHGQTEINRDGRLQGRLDRPLTELGREQARLVAAGLSSCGATTVLTSPLVRAADTASEIASVLGVAVEFDDRLLEVDYGEWDGRKLGDVSPDEWRHWIDDELFAPPGGESLVSVVARVGDFCADRLRADETLIAVGHVSPIKAGVVWALGIGAPAIWRMHLDVASVTRIDRRGEGLPFLLSYNETAHLT